MYLSFLYITEDGVYIKKRSGKFLVTKNNEIMFEIPQEKLEGLVVTDGVQISSQVIVEFLKKGVFLTWLSSTGEYFGRLEPTTHVNVYFQKKQALLTDDDTFCLSFAKNIIVAKTDNQVTLLRRYNRNIESSKVYMNIRNILSIKRNITTAGSIEQLMGFEGIISRIYFEALGIMVHGDFSFKGRNKRPPLDMFNSLLSFGYTLLMYELHTSITNKGLNAYFPLFHSIRTGHPALASDLMEEWRAVIVDSLVMSMIHRHEIKKDDFLPPAENGGIYLNRLGSKNFISAYEKKMRSVNKYVGEKHSFRYTIDRQVDLFVKSIMEHDPHIYKPIIIR